MRIVVPPLVLAMVALCCGGVYVELGRLVPGPTDTAKVASSSAVVEADRTSTAVVDARLSQILAIVGPAQATAVTDVCGIYSSGLEFGPSPAACERAVSAYLGTNDVPDPDTWDQALSRAGWYRISEPPGPPFSYVKNATMVRIDWLQQPATPGPTRRFVWQSMDYFSPVYREQRSVDISMFYPRYRYVVMVATSDIYYPVPKPPSPSPSPNDHACYSGSGNCIGG